MLDNRSVYDCLIVGAGPAGLSAAIYMARFLRRTLVLDNNQGRSTFGQVIENYLGFPAGVRARELREIGRRQAERFGAEFGDTTVTDLRRTDQECFLATSGLGDFQARTVILCTGVTDRWPEVPNAEEFVGRSLFWCITCDGFRAFEKRLVLFGNDDEAAVTAGQFRVYTDQITLVVSPSRAALSPSCNHELDKHGIEVLEGEAARFEGSPADLREVVLKDSRRIPADVVFSLLGCEPNSRLAARLGVERDHQGYIKVDQEGYTSVPGVFCAGDISRMHTHQVAAAANEGSEAAQTANYWLYSNYQRNEPERFSPEELAERVRSSA